MDNKDELNPPGSSLSNNTSKNDDNGTNKRTGVNVPKELTKKPPVGRRGRNGYSSSSSDSSEDSDDESVDIAALVADAQANDSNKQHALINKKVEKRLVHRDLDGDAVNDDGQKNKNCTKKARKEIGARAKKCLEEAARSGTGKGLLKHVTKGGKTKGTKAADAVISAVNSSPSDDDFKYKELLSIEEGGIDVSGFSIKKQKPTLFSNKRRITNTDVLDHIGKSMGFPGNPNSAAVEARSYFKSSSEREFDETKVSHGYKTNKNFNDLPRIVFRPTAKREKYAAFNKANKA